MAVILIHPNSVAVNATSAVIFSCLGYGLPIPNITWSTENGSILKNMSRISLYEELVNRSGVLFVKSVLEICSIEPNDATSYTCTVDNGISTDNVSVVLGILPYEGES